MSLDNLQLSASLLTSLYKTSLVATGEAAISSKPVAVAAPATTAPPAPAKPAFMGDNKKGILLLVNDATAPYLEETAFNFLLSILNACQLSMADVALVNTAQLSAFAHLPDELGSRHVLLFGIPAEHLALPILFPLYQAQPHGQRHYLTADPLAAIAQDKTLKGKLWQALKKMFQL